MANPSYDPLIPVLQTALHTLNRVLGSPPRQHSSRTLRPRHSDEPLPCPFTNCPSPSPPGVGHLTSRSKYVARYGRAYKPRRMVHIPRNPNIRRAVARLNDPRWIAITTLREALWELDYWEDATMWKEKSFTRRFLALKHRVFIERGEDNHPRVSEGVAFVQEKERLKFQVDVKAVYDPPIELTAEEEEFWEWFSLQDHERFFWNMLETLHEMEATRLLVARDLWAIGARFRRQRSLAEFFDVAGPKMPRERRPREDERGKGGKRQKCIREYFLLTGRQVIRVPVEEARMFEGRPTGKQSNILALFLKTD